MSPGRLNVYIYHPLQRSEWGDHFFPSGEVLPFSNEPFDFGERFVPRPDIVPELDRWHCYEFMLQANTPGENDGRIAFWFDGDLAADFGNLRLRDIDTLQIDRFGVGLHIGSNTPGAAHKWYDNVVAADAYIGPLYDGDAPPDTDSDSDSASESGSGSDSDSDSASASAQRRAAPARTRVPAPRPAPMFRRPMANPTQMRAPLSGDDTGCSCRSGSAPQPVWLLLLLPWLRRRVSPPAGK